MPDKIYFRVTLSLKTDEVRARMHGASREASMAAGRAVLAEANKTVPYETGRLRRSGRVDWVPRGGHDASVVSYSRPYAVRLHENPQYRFQGKGRGKWLQLALQEMSGRVRAIMAGEIERRIRR